MLQQFLGHLLPSLPLKWPDQVEVCFHQEEKLQSADALFGKGGKAWGFRFSGKGQWL